MRWRKAALAAYAAVAVATFGYAAADRNREDWARYSVCSTATPERICEQPRASDAGAAGLFGGALWPLYLSWVAAEKVEDRTYG